MTMAETNGGDKFHARHIDGNNYDPLEDNEANIDMSSTLLRATAVPPPNITVEDSLSMELMKLSMNDRQAMEEEVHGVYCMCTADETPEYLSEKLRDFDIALNEFRNSEKRLRKMERIRLQREANDCKEGRDPNTNYEEDFDVLRNVIRITDDMKMVDEEESTKCTMETTASRSSLCSITTDFPDDLGGDEKEARKKSCWVNDPDVRLRFLRSELFDAERAVMRFVVFLDFAQELYGDFIADRPMRLSDINTREEKRVMARIQFRILPFRDRSGRRVFVSVGTCGYDVEPSLRIKILWYMFWIASEDIETQRKGLVIVGWPCNEIISGDSGNIPMSEDDTKCCDGEGGNTSAWEHSLRPGIANIEGVYQVKAIDGLPIRIAALHFCLQNRPVYRILNALFFFALNSSYKSRYKVHIGEPLEIRYKLQGYGIPVDLLPVTHTMTLKRQTYLQWINFRKFVEQDNSGKTNTTSKIKIPLLIDLSDIVECPRSHDVIIGKAKYTNNPGNVFYRSLIEATHDEHMSLSKKEKVEMTWRIVRQIEEMEGRFLEMNKQLKMWVHIKDRSVMRQKVAQSYKEYKRNAHVVRTKRQKEQTQNMRAVEKRRKMMIHESTIPESACFVSVCTIGGGMRAVVTGNDVFDSSPAMFTSM